MGSKVSIPAWTPSCRTGPAADALRMAVAIGGDARSEALTRFIADPKVPVLVAGEPDQITNQLRLVTLAVTGALTFAEGPNEGGPAIDDPDVPI